jgi:hypothetical protein
VLPVRTAAPLPGSKRNRAISRDQRATGVRVHKHQQHHMSPSSAAKKPQSGAHTHRPRTLGFWLSKRLLSVALRWKSWVRRAGMAGRARWARM